jgi:2-amino-4-hydroxy-6-hydroxymethyldihydropteridine diphosphokinase
VSLAAISPAGRSPRGLVAIGLGANLGSRWGPPAATLAWAGERLAALLPGLRLAPLYRTAPISHLAQPDFFNTVALADEPPCSPRELLAELKKIEKEAGRGAPIERDAPRVLDLDLLFFGGLELEEPGLTLPHPRLRGRLFVLAPLRDLEPELALPPDGRTVAELYAAIAGTQEIARA